ncbi:MAG: acylphosphatase [Burkholderiales bacterium]|nr:acylphosphatase [Burkholderiales bacterium]
MAPVRDDRPHAVQHLLIRGRVQGVGYRWAMAEQAQQLGLSGWVRNRRDGTVEAVAAGPPDALMHLLRWARRGPPAARVSEVLATPATGEFVGFEQRPTV